MSGIGKGVIGNNLLSSSLPKDQHANQSRISIFDWAVAQDYWAQDKSGLTTVSALANSYARIIDQN